MGEEGGGDVVVVLMSMYQLGWLNSNEAIDHQNNIIDFFIRNYKRDLIREGQKEEGNLKELKDCISRP